MQLTSALIVPTEREFTAQCLALAHLYGWLTMHERPARRLDGTWRTPAQGDGAGWPDLVLCRPPRLIFAELKAEHGKIAPLQQRWLDALRAVPGCEVYVWRPAQLADEINQVLA